VLRMNQTLGLACVLAFSSIGVCTLPALAAAFDSNQSESEKPAPPDAGSREAPGTNSSAPARPREQILQATTRRKGRRNQILPPV
jgi:hypothetical protein